MAKPATVNKASETSTKIVSPITTPALRIPYDDQ